MPATGPGRPHPALAGGIVRARTKAIVYYMSCSGTVGPALARIILFCRCSAPLPAICRTPRREGIFVRCRRLPGLGAACPAWDACTGLRPLWRPEAPSLPRQRGPARCPAGPPVSMRAGRARTDAGAFSRKSRQACPARGPHVSPGQKGHLVLCRIRIQQSVLPQLLVQLVAGDPKGTCHQ